MTVAVATPFNMDEQAFLQTMDRLIERFDRYSSGRCFADLDRIRLEHDMEGPLSLFDDVVHELADDLFGGTSWPVNLDMDMIILDRFQIGYDAEFLTGCRNVVRKYGMSAWLYEMINDASVAVATHRPSNRMPFQLGLFDTREVFRRKKTKGKKSGGGRRKRLECMMEYLRQTYRLAAYTLLRWGGGEPRAADAALMVLAYGGLGMCMLRDDRSRYSQAVPSASRSKETTSTNSRPRRKPRGRHAPWPATRITRWWHPANSTILNPYTISAHASTTIF